MTTTGSYVGPLATAVSPMSQTSSPSRRPFGQPLDLTRPEPSVVVSPPMKPRRLNPAWPARVTGGVVVSTLSTSGMNTALRSARPDVANVVPKTKLIREASSGFSAYVAKASSPGRRGAVQVVLVLQRDEPLVEE